MATDCHKSKIIPVASYIRVQFKNFNIKVISTGTNNRRTAIVPKSPATKRPPERKVTQLTVKQNMKLAYQLPLHEPRSPSFVMSRADSRKSPIAVRLHRRAHAKNPFGKEHPANKILGGSPTVASPDRTTSSPIEERDDHAINAPNESNTWQLYPSSIFGDYFSEPESTIESPIHTIEPLKARSKRRSRGFNGDEGDIWGAFWTDKMEMHPERRLVPERTANLRWRL